MIDRFQNWDDLQDIDRT